MNKYIIYFLCIITIGCTEKNVEKPSKASAIDSAALPFENELNSINDNVERVNSIKEWTRILKKSQFESAEGGEVCYFYSGSKLEKIVTNNYGETGNRVAEYYLFNNKLSFVLEKSEVYNRPIYWDSTNMKENNDKETLDPSKTEVVEERFYFENEVIIHNTNNQDCGAPDAIEFVIQQQKRIIEDYKKLIALLNK